MLKRPEVVRALEQKLLHAIINCLAAGETDQIVFQLVQTPRSKTQNTSALC